MGFDLMRKRLTPVFVLALVTAVFLVVQPSLCSKYDHERTAFGQIVTWDNAQCSDIRYPIGQINFMERVFTGVYTPVLGDVRAALSDNVIAFMPSPFRSFDGKRWITGEQNMELINVGLVPYVWMSALSHEWLHDALEDLTGDGDADHAKADLWEAGLLTVVNNMARAELCGADCK